MVVGGRELIDTLWNVNKTARTMIMIITHELIDTLWNVNHMLMGIHSTCIGN